MEKIPISEFKSKFKAVMDRIRKTKMARFVTHQDTIVAARISGSSMSMRSAWIGSMTDSIEILDDLVLPASAENEWEALRD